MTILYFIFSHFAIYKYAVFRPQIFRTISANIPCCILLFANKKGVLALKNKEFEPWRVRAREIRAEKHISCEKIAEEMKMSLDTVSNFFASDSDPRISTAAPIIEALGCTWDDIFLGAESGKVSKVVQNLIVMLEKSESELGALSNIKEDYEKTKEQLAKVTEEKERLEIHLMYKDKLLDVYEKLNK